MRRKSAYGRPSLRKVDFIVGEYDGKLDMSDKF